LSLDGFIPVHLQSSIGCAAYPTDIRQAATRHTELSIAGARRALAFSKLAKLAR
jgi:hypothetical protein